MTSADIPRLVARTTSPTGAATDESLRAVVAWLGAGPEADYIQQRIGTGDAGLLAQATCAARDAIERRQSGAAGKPGADLVALFDAFAHAAPAYSSLQLHGDAAADALLAWGHGARTERRERADGTAWTVAAVDLPHRVWIVAHFDRDVAQADQQVLARVQAALDGEQPECSTCGAIHADVDCFGEPIKQPEAAEGSV